MTSLRAIRLSALVLATIMSCGSVKADPLEMAAINAMDRPHFVATFGTVFEKSPWVADGAFDKKPFSDVEALHGAMVAVVAHATLAQQLALLKAHPDLAGKEAAAGTMTASSNTEQAGAGLTALSRSEMDEIGSMNAAHEKTFGFPFIIVVRKYTKAQIFAEFKRRLASDTQTEYVEDLKNVYAITRLRLNNLVH